jgi:hypothetical protein
MLTAVLAVTLTLSRQAAVAAQSLDDVFTVQRGNTLGSCDNHRSVLDRVHFPEVRALTNAALSAINNHRTSRPARDHLTSFFGVKFRADAGNAPVDEALLARVKGKWKHL